MPEATSSGIVPATAPSVDTSMRTASPEPFIASGSHAADKPQMAPPLQAGGEQRDGPASQLPCSQDQQELQKGSEVVEGQAGAEADGGEDVQEDGHQLPLPVPVVCDESLLLMGPQETEPVQQHETEGGASAQETELVVADGNLTHEAEPPSRLVWDGAKTQGHVCIGCFSSAVLLTTVYDGAPIWVGLGLEQRGMLFHRHGIETRGHLLVHQMKTTRIMHARPIYCTALFNTIWPQTTITLPPQRPSRGLPAGLHPTRTTL